MLIYALKNNAVTRPDGTPKLYIGKTEYSSAQNRWEMHQYEVSSGSGFYIHNAIRKHGELAFEVVVLESDIEDPKVLCEREIYWIAQYRSNERDWGYNMTPGGDNPPNHKGKKYNETHRANISKAQMGRPGTFGHLGKTHTEESKREMALFRTQLMASLSEDEKRINTQKARNQIKELREQGVKVGGAPSGEDNFMFGKQHSEETRQKISESLTGKPGHATKGRTGMPHTEESKRLMAQKARATWAARRSAQSV